jgi:hypothetical protein
MRSLGGFIILMKTLELSGFLRLKTRAKRMKRFIIEHLGRTATSSQGVFGILTPINSKTPYITAKKNKKSMIPSKQETSGFSRLERSGIAYITVKKITKSLTFNFSCARNTLVMKMKLTFKRRYLWLY